MSSLNNTNFPQIISYDGQVSGSNNQLYSVHIYKEHPRKSACNCPFAVGRRVICKRMIALYLTAEPNVAEDFMKQAEEWEKEEEERERQHYIDIKNYVNGLSKDELRQELFDVVSIDNEYNERYCLNASLYPLMSELMFK